MNLGDSLLSLYYTLFWNPSGVFLVTPITATKPQSRDGWMALVGNKTVFF